LIERQIIKILLLAGSALILRISPGTFQQFDLAAI
jgi:hypothetical protein